MRSFLQGLLTVALVATAAGAGAQSAAPPPTAAATAEAWRQQYERDLRAEYGWLSVAGLTFLPEGTHTVGSDPASAVVLPAGHAPQHVGRLEVTDEGVTLYLESGVEALLNGKPSPPVVTLKKAGKTAPGQPAAQPDKVRVGRLEFHLHESGDRLALRVRDPESPIRIGFQGPRWFPVTDSARVIATLKRFDEPRSMEVRNILGDNEPYSSPGQLEFPWEGRTLRVLAFTSTRGRLQVIFRDASVGRDTYGTRYVYAEPTGDGRYLLDFNKAYNPPCAYNPYTTCPTPPSQNILKVPIRAGEKIYDAPQASASR
jgi:uncharacterized protein (DUF1684 family)